MDFTEVLEHISYRDSQYELMQQQEQEEQEQEQEPGARSRRSRGQSGTREPRRRGKEEANGRKRTRRLGNGSRGDRREEDRKESELVTLIKQLVHVETLSPQSRLALKNVLPFASCKFRQQAHRR